jgi:hypothetical protein
LYYSVAVATDLSDILTNKEPSFDLE